MNYVPISIFLDEEEWKPIHLFPNYYISNYGRVYSTLNKIILKPQKRPNGYLKYTLRYNGRVQKNYSIHKLVAEHFCNNDDPINKTYINHIDGIKDNNYYRNLEWCTPKENTQHSIKMGLTDNRGESCTTSIYTENTIKLIVYYINRGYPQGQIYELVKHRKDIYTRAKTIDLVKKLRRGVVWKHVLDNQNIIVDI